MEIRYQRKIDLSAAEVWAELRHFDRVLNWVPGGKNSTIAMQGEGPGAVRTLHLTTQGYVQHKLLTCDNTKRMLSYTLTGGKPLGMRDYTVTAKVGAINDHLCCISWQGEMTAQAPLNAGDIGPALEVGLQNMTSGLIAYIKGQPPQYRHQPNEDWQQQHTQAHARE